MSQPLTVTIPHQLGRAEARRRIEDGLGRFTDQFGKSGSTVDKTWVGDKLSFTVQAMGQAIVGTLDVFDDTVAIEVLLPGFFGLMAGKIKGKLQEQGQLMLEKK